jgi:hypothetical protein
MKDNIMEERSKNFENKNINQLKFNCVNSNGISLRKKNVNDMLLIKRNINLKKTSKFDIDLSLNDLPLNEQKLFSNIEKEDMSFFKIIIEPIISINSKLFLIKELNKRLDNETILTKNNLNFLPANLCGYFVDVDERLFKIKQIIYQILLVMIKITLLSNDPEIMDIFNNINVFDFIFKILYSYFNKIEENFELIVLAIIFSTNILDNNITIRDNIYNKKIFDLIYNFVEINKYNKQLSHFEIIKVSIGFFACFSKINFDNYCLEEEMEIINKGSFKLLDVFSFFLQNNFNKEEIVKDCIWGLYYLTRYPNCNEIIPYYFNNDILNNLYNLCNKNMYYFMIIVRILGNITSLNDDFADLITNSLLNDNIPYLIKKEILWLISNICIGTDLKCLFQYNLSKTIIDVIKNDKNIKIKTEGMNLILNCIINSKDTKIICKEIVNLVCKFFNENISKEMIAILCLMCESILKENNDDYNRILNENGIKDVLEKWVLMNENEISELSERLLKIYFN